MNDATRARPQSLLASDMRHMLSIKVLNRASRPCQNTPFKGDGHIRSLPQDANRIARRKNGCVLPNKVPNLYVLLFPIRKHLWLQDPRDAL